MLGSHNPYYSMEYEYTSEDAVELGFLVSPEENWHIWDSAKFGGKPYWLVPEHIPGIDDLKCQFCEKPMCFMMQLYNPCDDNEDAYHRSIYVFVCRNQACLEKGSSCVLRCQLPKKNPYYPEDIDSVVDDCYFDPNCSYSPLHYGIHLCSVCGIKATSKCAKCNAYYCSRDHQIVAWKNGHKDLCGKGDLLISKLFTADVYPGVQFPHWEVDMFPEPKPTKAEIVSEEAERERLKKFSSLDPSMKITDSDIRDAMGGRLEDDPVHLHFNKVMERANTQVIRLSRWRNEDILWANGSTILDLEKVPTCPYCNQPRKFEFQIMPQLIYLLGSDGEKKDYPEIDFGSLVVFTCCNSCSYILNYLPFSILIRTIK